LSIIILKFFVIIDIIKQIGKRKDNASMKIKKIICSAMAVLLVIPALGGCKHIEKDDMFKVESQASKTVSTVSKSTDESSTQASTSSTDSNLITPLMWKAEDKDGNYAYLFGSIHAADDMVNHLPDYFEKAYSDSDMLAFEVDMSDIFASISTDTKFLTEIIYSDGTTIKDHISSDTYSGLVEILKENGMYNAMYDYYKPLMWESLLENIIISKAGLNSSNGVDITLTNRAKNDGKQIDEVESMEFQMSMFNNFSDELIELMLAQYAETNAIDEQTNEIKALYEKWKTGTMSAEDVSDDTDLNMEELTEEQKKLFEEYNKSMLIDRNEGMTEKLIEYMKGDKITMLVVGSAHFLGDDGIISLLQKQGITVTKIISPDQITVTEKLPEAA